MHVMDLQGWAQRLVELDAWQLGALLLGALRLHSNSLA
jgi:hypothetical protein